MATITHPRTDGAPVAYRAHGEETKPSFKTTELIVYVLSVIGVLVASKMVGDGAADNGADRFAADRAWWYITLLTIGYMVSRGLAKAGSRSHDHDPRTR
ncbi:hypothetical protein [Actinoplanes teichomyceticus]|uniref:Uncharacterized protein n=1 Tax=Actinoplanes teichomyceticus TaxID=1867 RepID=A0A561VIE2_ACTTI|nr:hypothetical protein [Actinoplanes teichomyceticus]TWG11376.1 hypothetical protein FHX34_106106 [Actinoplanes teichomyceticus]GIF15810.1 hypothetical protein Ate01nite_58420 [Actinoplanes teichomyceticus]